MKNAKQLLTCDVCVPVLLSTTVIHNTAQSGSDYFLGIVQVSTRTQMLSIGGKGVLQVERLFRRNQTLLRRCAHF